MTERYSCAKAFCHDIFLLDRTLSDGRICRTDIAGLDNIIDEVCLMLVIVQHWNQWRSQRSTWVLVSAVTVGKFW